MMLILPGVCSLIDVSLYNPPVVRIKKIEAIGKEETLACGEIKLAYFSRIFIIAGLRLYATVSLRPNGNL